MSKYQPMTTFSQNIRSKMQADEWTQQQLAEVCGWTQPDISRLLHAKGNPTLETMEVVASALGVPLYELLTPAEMKQKVSAA